MGIPGSVSHASTEELQAMVDKELAELEKTQ